MSGAPRDPARRRARLHDALHLAGGLVAAVSGAFWVCVQEGPDATATRLVVPALAACVVLVGRPSRARGAGMGLLAALLLGLLSRFYYQAERPAAPPYAFPRLEEVPGGNALLPLSVLTSLACLLGWGLGLARRHPKGLLALGYALALGLVSGVALDLAFVGRAPHGEPPAIAHPFLVSPYSMFAPPGSYAYAHAQERTVWDTREVLFSQQKPPGTLRVVLCGASTMYGNRLPAERAFGAVLRSLLAAELPGRNVEVLTVAQPGKYQLDELIDAVVTLPHWDPDLVISFDGINELWYGERADYFEGMPNPMALLAGQLTALGQLGRASYLANDLHTRAPLRLPYALRDQSVYEPPRYFSYLRGTAWNLKRLGIPYAYAFCPTVHEKPLRTAEEEGFLEQSPWLAPAPERRRRAAEIVTEEGQISYDVMGALAGVHEQAFYDGCHFTPRGIELVSRDLAPRIPGWLGGR